jgi:hypothetical protein
MANYTKGAARRLQRRPVPADTWTKEELVRKTNAILRRHKQPLIRAPYSWDVARRAYENTVRFYAQAAGG